MYIYSDLFPVYMNFDLKVQCRFENRPIPSSSHQNNVSKISDENTFYFFRYAYLRYVKTLFTKIQKQWNKTKISLLFKKFTNFTDNLLENS